MSAPQNSPAKLLSDLKKLEPYFRSLILEQYQSINSQIQTKNLDEFEKEILERLLQPYGKQTSQPYGKQTSRELFANIDASTDDSIINGICKNISYLISNFDFIRAAVNNGELDNFCASFGIDSSKLSGLATQFLESVYQYLNTIKPTLSTSKTFAETKKQLEELRNIVRACRENTKAASAFLTLTRNATVTQISPTFLHEVLEQIVVVKYDGASGVKLALEKYEFKSIDHDESIAETAKTIEQEFLHPQLDPGNDQLIIEQILPNRGIDLKTKSLDLYSLEKIIAAIKTGRPQTVLEVLTKYGFKDATIEQAEYITNDFFCSLINPGIRDIIQSAIEKKPITLADLGIDIAGAINDLNTAYSNGDDEKIKGYLFILGLSNPEVILNDIKSQEPKTADAVPKIIMFLSEHGIIRVTRVPLPNNAAKEIEDAILDKQPKEIEKILKKYDFEPNEPEKFNLLDAAKYLKQYFYLSQLHPDIKKVILQIRQPLQTIHATLSTERILAKLTGKKSTTLYFIEKLNSGYESGNIKQVEEYLLKLGLKPRQVDRALQKILALPKVKKTLDFDDENRYIEDIFYKNKILFFCNEQFAPSVAREIITTIETKKPQDIAAVLVKYGIISEGFPEKILLANILIQGFTNKHARTAYKGLEQGEFVPREEVSDGRKSSTPSAR